MAKATRFSGVASFFSEGASFFSGSAATTQATADGQNRQDRQEARLSPRSGFHDVHGWTLHRDAMMDSTPPATRTCPPPPLFYSLGRRNCDGRPTLHPYPSFLRQSRPRFLMGDSMPDQPTPSGDHPLAAPEGLRFRTCSSLALRVGGSGPSNSVRTRAPQLPQAQLLEFVSPSTGFPWPCRGSRPAASGNTSCRPQRSCRSRPAAPPCHRPACCCICRRW